MAKNIELLKRLRTRFLRMRHEKHFDMDTWGRKTECGTVACIAGHALLLQGYRLKFDPIYGFGFWNPKSRRVGIFQTAARELGLDAIEAANLFYDNSLKTPKQAAARIEKIIAEAQG